MAKWVPLCRNLCRHLCLLGGLLLSGVAQEPEADLLDNIILFDLRTQEPINMGPVNRSTVRGFELLYATPGAGDISEIAGHLLLRVKLAGAGLDSARGGQPDARDEHPHDHPHDLVISFLADTERDRPLGRQAGTSTAEVVAVDCHRRNWLNLIEANAPGESPFVSIWQSLKGLSGGFPMIMDRQTLEQALKSYTVEQDRDLLRYELLLSESQQQDLLSHLLWVRDHYEPPYYFFSQNCGSVLLEVIGQGIGDAEIAGFHPMVAPPNTLVGNLLRKGLARPVLPSFYSYRQQGFIAQRLLRARYGRLLRAHPDLAWPPLERLFHRDHRVRAETIFLLPDLPGDDAGLYLLLSLLQEADMVFADKGLRCENYTSDAVAAARARQREWLLRDPERMPPALDVDEVLQAVYAPFEQAGFAQGTAHTGLFKHRLSLGLHGRGKADSSFALGFSASILEQDMGSSSAIAMQRSSAVTLGAAEVVASADGIAEWGLSGLDLRKFRDTLDRVPSGLNSLRGVGIGLSLLNLHHQTQPKRTDASLAGAALLCNLFSSPQHNHFLYLSLGSDLAWHEVAGHSSLGVELPLRAESLISLGPRRNLQWRNDARIAWSLRSDTDAAWRLRSGFRYRLGEWAQREWHLAANVAYRDDPATHTHGAAARSHFASLSLDVLRW